MEMPVKVVPVREPMSTVAKASVEDMTGAKSAAVEAAAASTVKSATSVVAAAVAAVTTMTASDFGRQPVGSMVCRRH
jgi:hypothetical protein